MKAQVLQETFTKTLSVALRFTAARAQLPILGNILLKTKANKLILSATNLETSYCGFLGAKVEGEGEITIPAKALTEIVANLKSGTVQLETEKEQLKIVADKFKFQLSGINAADFPSVPEGIDKTAASLPPDKLVMALEKCLFAVSSDQSRPILTGALMVFGKKGLTVVASDGFRLSSIELPTVSQMEDKQLVLPKSVLAEVVKLSPAEEEIKMTFRKADNQMVFAIGDGIVASRVLQGTFPDYQKIIPKGFELKVLADREELLRGVKLASIVAREAANVVKLNITQEKLTFLAESSAVGKHEGEVEVKLDPQSTKKELEIAFNFRFLEEFLLSTQGESITMEFGSSSTPGVFRDPNDPAYFHLIMPVKS